MITLKKLFISRAHLGHKVKQWNPKMSSYIYTERNGLHIIDLVRTLVCLKRVTNFLTKSTKKGKTFDFNLFHKVLILYRIIFIKILCNIFFEKTVI
jgi:small subunit ribosomal protein S2